MLRAGALTHTHTHAHVCAKASTIINKIADSRKPNAARVCLSVCVRVLYYFQLTRQSRVHAVAKHNHTDCAAAAAATVNVVAAVARILNRVRRTLLARVYVAWYTCIMLGGSAPPPVRGAV